MLLKPIKASRKNYIVLKKSHNNLQTKRENPKFYSLEHKFLIKTRANKINMENI